MDTQHAVLSKIVLDGELTPFIEAKIGPKFFSDPEHARIWGMVAEHYQKYGKAPDPEVIHKAYPTYAFTEYPEPTGYYLHQLQEDRKKVILTRCVQEYAARLSEAEGPDIGSDLETILRRGLTQANHEISQGRDSDFFMSNDRHAQTIRELRTNRGEIRGISTGFPGIDRLTGGLQPEQLVTIIGIPKTGKSSVLLKMAYNAHRNGSNPLFVTFEMSTAEQEGRLYSLLSGIGLSKILNGDLDDEEEAKILKALALRQDMAGFTITSDVFSAITVSGIQAKINQYQPAVVFIDGAYLMDDEQGHEKNSPQALTTITRSLKRVAQTTRLPIVITTAALGYRSKGGLKVDSIGYSSSFAQDSDIVFGVEAEEKNLPGVSKFHVVASRSTPKGAVFVHFDWSEGVVDELGELGLDQAKQGQSKAAEPTQTDIGY